MKILLKGFKYFSAVLILLSSFKVYGQWVQTSFPLDKPGRQLVVIGNNIFCATDTIGVYCSANNGATWDQQLNNTGYNYMGISTLIGKDGNLFAGTNGMGIYFSSDNGNNWISKNNGLPSYPAVTQLYADGQNIFGSLLSGGIYLSTDDGANWKSINNGLPSNIWITSVAAVNGNLVAGTFMNAVFLSTDNGANWSAITNGLPSLTYTYKLLSIGSNIFIATASGLFISSDNGVSWAPINKPGMITSIIFTDNNNLYAGSIDAVKGSYIFYSSENNGDTWNEINTGLPDSISMFNSFTVCNSYAYLSLNTYQLGKDKPFGVWRRSLSELTTSVKQINSDSPVCFTLNQNYPNPFNPTTIIKYQIPKSSFVSVKVYDLLGNEIATLVNKEQTAGSYEVEFAASGLSAGIYFYRLRTDNYGQTKKMILLK